MAFRRSLDFLPNFFKTETNSKFLNATLDQLISEPELKRLDGFIGRKFAPSYKQDDSYVTEINDLRQQYQLEPSTIYRDSTDKIQLASSYQDLLSRISSLGGIVQDQSRLFTSKQYTYSGLFDFDKFINYASYYWLPEGPDPVDVSSVPIPTEQEFEVTPPKIYQTVNGEFERENFDTTGFDASINPLARVRNDGYKFTGYGNRINPRIRLARGGSYTFNLDQIGHGFFIQTRPGLSPSEPWQQNLSIRDINGVVNNGIDVGSITFSVPAKDAEEFYINMSSAGTSSFVARSGIRNRLLRYVELQYKNYADLIAEHGGLDNQRFVDGKTVVFLQDPTFDAVPVAWSSYTEYNEGDLVKYGNNSYRVLTGYTSGRLFTSNNLELFDAQNDWYDPVPFDGNDFPFDSSNFDRGGSVAPEDKTARFRINLVDGLVKLSPEDRITINSKITVAEGTAYGNREIYRNVNDYLELIPNITANLDFLYYQDSLDPNINGAIEIIDQDTDGSIYVEDSIIGKPTYVSPNDVTFTNGLKVKFRNKIDPESYQDNEYYVEGVGNSITLVPVQELVTPELWLDSLQVSFDTVGFDDSPFDAQDNSPLTKDYITINRSSRDKNAWSRGNRWFHEDVIQLTAEYNNYQPVLDFVSKAKRPIIEFQPDIQLFNSGKTAKLPVDVIDFETTDAFSNIQGKAIEIIGSSINSQNSDGIALIPGLRIIFPADIDSDVRNKIYQVNWIRPESNDDKRSVSFIGDGSTSVFDLNFDVTDQINLQVLIDGVNANTAGYNWAILDDQLLTFDVSGGLTAPDDGATITAILEARQRINLELVDNDINEFDTVTVLQGQLYQGKQFYFDGNTWTLSQVKSSVNQSPLFDLVDQDLVSLADTSKYPSNNFVGNKIFGYQVATTGNNDVELGFKLKYRNFNNVGDILFSDYITGSTFNYRIGVETISESTAGDKVIHNLSDGTQQYLNQWQENEFKTTQFQTQTFFATQYQKNLFLLNVIPTDKAEPLSPENLLVYVNNQALNNDKYDIQLEGSQGYLLLDDDLTVGDKLDVKISSANTNAASVYEIPADLEYNPLNAEIGNFTLGQIRSHILKVYENTPGLLGNFIGINNSRDLGNIKKYGGKIVQNLGSSHLANLFLNDVQANFVESVLYVQREYSRFKNKILELLVSLPLTNPLDPVKSLDEAIIEISSNKSHLFPFFASDMIGYGIDYKKLTYTVNDVTLTTYDITDLFDGTVPGSNAISVYKNGNLLINGLEYTIPSDQPIIQLILDTGEKFFNQSTLTIALDDIIEIREYSNTDGSHVPPTPSKLGMYPSFIPQFVSDGRPGTTRSMLRGHDGSLTALFGDHRDDCLLEFERRIYNNLKVSYVEGIYDIKDYIPGGFRTTPYTKQEYDQILSSNFSSWLGKTGLRPSEYAEADSNDPWTWNYSSATSKVDGNAMPAAYWRGIYRYYFDTDVPHLRPWEMLGFADEPNWWSYYYGSAPYTRGNDVLWDDLARGYIASGERAGIDDRFIRPNLIDYIPVDESGIMLPPSECVVKNYNKLNIDGKFIIGDSGPVETAWRQSSEYPFAAQIALALMEPAEYFGANIDKNKQVLKDFGTNGKQWVFSDTGLRSFSDQLVHGEIDTAGNAVKVNSYTTWISEYAKALGLDRTTAVGDKLRDSTVQLSYKVAGYSDKKFLKVYADQATPNSTNTSVMIPDDDFDVVLVKGAPTQSVTYSGVIITKNANGYSVNGYDDTRPYFTIETSASSGRKEAIKVGNVSAVKYLDGTGLLLQVPYGTEFISIDQTVDFLISYGRYLTRQGFQFTDKLDEDAGFYKDWDLAAREFLFYVQQGWEQSISISLSPIGSSVKFTATLGMVDGLTNKATGTRVLTEDFNILRPEDYTVNREGKNFSLTVQGGSGIYLLDLDVVNYEHVLVFRNTTQFNDIIYDPAIGVRQYRLKLRGFKTGNWDGSFGAAGFILNEDNIIDWQQGKNYYKGDIVKFKEAYYTASSNVNGSNDFDNQTWLKSDYTKVNKGLLPSLSNKASQFKSFYDINAVNLELDADRLGKGLIGLRPRSYLEDLQISDTSQAKFYQGMITQKGSKNSFDKLLRAKIDNFDGSINFYEEWAIRTGQYGATDIRQQLQIAIDESTATRDPIVIELLGPNDVATTGRLSYRESDIWGKAKPFVPNFLGTESGSNLPYYLPSAGYVRLDDVAWTASSLSNLNTQIDPKVVGRGDLIFIAADKNNLWSIYRIDETETRLVNVSIAANGLATLEFNNSHGLAEQDVVLIKTINNQPAITSFYSVSTVLSNTKIIVETNFSTLPTAKVSGTLFILTNQRFADSSEIIDREPILGWKATDKLFVDSATSTGWGVYEKQDAYLESTQYFPADPLSLIIEPDTTVNAAFGTSMAVDRSNIYMLVGQPGDGSVVSYGIVDDELVQDLVISSPSDGTSGFGTEVKVSDNGLAVIAAPSSDSNTGYVFLLKTDPGTQKFNIEQAIPPYDLDVGGNFGSAIAISDDGQWLAVGQPDFGGGFVYIYQLNEAVIPPTGTQTLTYDGSSLTFTLDGSAADPQSIDALTVTANGITLDPGTDYTLSGSDITFIASPVAEGGKIYVEVARAEPEQKFTGDGSTIVFTLTGDNATPSSVYALKIVVDGILQIPFRDYDLSTNVITFTTAPIDNAGITVFQKTHFSYIDAFTAADNAAGDRFGASLDWTDDGRRLIIGAPSSEVSAITNAGSIYVYDRTAIENISDGDTTEYTVDVQTPITRVYVGDDIQTLERGDGNGDYTLDAGSVIFTVAPPAGEKILIENNYIFQTAKIVAPTAEANAYLGTSAIVCPYACSVYAGAPYTDGTNDKDDTGSVIRWVNQGRAYGTITGSVVNPVVSPAGYLILNDRWINISDASNLSAVITAINDAEVPGVIASNVGNALKIISNSDVAADKLKISASATTILSDLGLEIYPYQQTIKPSKNEAFGNFGKKLAITSDAETLVVASDRATSDLPVTFDAGETTLDYDTTSFLDITTQSGAVFTYQYISRVSESVSTPGSFIPAQRLVSSDIDSMDQFGASIVVTDNKIYVGAPGDDTYASNGGIAFSFKLGAYDRAWSLIRSESAKVNVDLINRVNLIDTKNNVIVSDLDFIDPFKGKISGIAAQEIEYRVSYDPAVYNIVSEQLINTKGVVWGKEQAGKLWWNTSQTRWLEYEQGDIDFRVANWGTAFPRSTIYCFEWTESTVPPNQYVDANNNFAFVVSGSRYSRLEYIDETGNVQVRYYFWVGGKTTVPDVSGRTLSAVDVENLIANPRAAGVPFAAFVATNAIALFNCKRFLRNSDIVLNIDYDLEENDSNIHAEYQMVRQGDANSKPVNDIITKMIDSLAGSDVDGRLVPDVYLTLGRKYGKEFRPRQTMFRDRVAALKTAIDYMNVTLAVYPVLLEKDVTGLLASDPIPGVSSGEWNEEVANLVERDYLLINVLPVGYAVLVRSNEEINDRWSIFKVAYLEDGITKYWKLYRTQAYANADYISEIDWTKPGEIFTTLTDYVLDFNYQLAEITGTLDITVKVKDDGRGYYTIYKYNSADEWEPIIREKATVKILDNLWDQSITLQGFDREGFDLQAFDDWANIETQNILRAVYDDLFTVDQEIEKNNWFFIMVQQLLQEQKYVDWIFKSSFITIEQRQRAISQIASYQKDNQDLVIQYINEVKPFHTKVREFILKYDGSDEAEADLSDFDVPAYYLSSTGKYRSPNGSQTIDKFILDLSPYTAWRDNHTFGVDEIVIIDGGSEYTVAPVITISGGGGSGATAETTILNGAVVAVTVTNSGTGYITTPTVTVNEGGAGTTAVAVARLANNKIRKIAQTIKFDRVSTPNAGLLVEFKDAAGDTIDIRDELISRVDGESGVLDYLLDLLSQDVATTSYAGGYWIVDSVGLVSYPLSVPNYKIFSDTSGRVQVLYQKKMQGWTAAKLQAAIRDLGASVGINSIDVTGTVVSVDGSMSSYVPSVFAWTADTAYDEDDIITYNYKAYRATTGFVSDAGFADDYLELITGADFENHLDRTWTYYQPSSGQFGRDLGQLFSGIEYPGVNVKGASFSMEPGFDVGGYDTEGFDTFVIGPEGIKVLDPAVLDQTLYSQFLDTELGTRPEDITTFGGDFVSAYSSHSPEEMIPGRVFDTVDIKVYSSPSDNWSGNGELGLGITVTSTVANGNTVFSYIAPQGQADTLIVFTTQLGRLFEGVDYTGDRIGKEITVSRLLTVTDTVFIYAIDNGGPGMVFSQDFSTDGIQKKWDIPVNRNRITQVYVTIDGVMNNDYTLDPASYDPDVSTEVTTVNFATAPVTGQSLFIHAFYSDTGQQALTEIYNTAVVLAGGTYPVDHTITLDKSIGYAYPLADKLIVEVNGSRLRPPNQSYHSGDGSTVIFLLPATVYVDPDDVIDAEIKASINGVEKQLNVDWVLDASDGSTIRSIVFNSSPALGDEIVISLNKGAGYSLIDENTVLISESINLNANDKINILTFKNHDNIKMRTEVFQGSSTNSTTVSIGFDDVGFDTTVFEGTVTTLSTVTQYELSRAVGTTAYLWVTLDVTGVGTGVHLNPGIDYRMISDTMIELGAGLGITPDSIIVVTSFSEEVQKPSIGFRIFKDMNDNVEYYRIARSGTTKIVKEVDINDSLIYVDDASKLPIPNPERAIPGAIIIGGERIHYYTIDLINNTIGQLRRGTSGTGAIQTIVKGATVHDMSLDQKIPESHGKIWYDLGTGTPSNGLGLQYSTTEQAKFLLSSPTPLESQVFDEKYIALGYVESSYVQGNVYE